MKRSINIVSTFAVVSTLLAGSLVSPAAARANINLEWRPSTATVDLNVTSSVSLGLYAVADNDNESIGAMDVIFTWDPTHIQLLGLDGTGGAQLLSSGFPTLLHYGLNESVPPQDGDGLYRAQALLGQPIRPTTAGQLITTFEFEALGPIGTSMLEILAEGGNNGETIVYDGEIPNFDVTGSLGSATITTVPEPSTLILTAVAGLALVRRRAGR